jgi:hypothetical protein
VGDIRAFGDLRLVDDVSAADWIVSSVRNFEYDVGSLLPVAFEAYARVLHPAHGDGPAGDDVDVTWAEVAAANGRVAHAGMEWVGITGDWSFMTHGRQAGLWDHPPSIGSLPQGQATTLADVLQRFTQDPSDCWFAVWDGYGNDPFPPGTVPLIAMPNRAMALLRGPISAATSAFSRRRWPESASLWWPGDRTWCVATDIDLMSTYVGGARACIDAVLADESLEAFEVSVDQTVHWRSDTINPTPEPPPDPAPVDNATRRRVLETLRQSRSSASTVTSRAPRPAPPGDTPGQ